MENAWTQSPLNVPTSASLTRENLAEREAETGNLPWTQTERDNATAKCRLGLRAWRAKRPMLCLHAVTVEALENDDESDRRLCECWVRFSKHASRARDITSAKTYCSMFRNLLTTSVGPLIVPNVMNSLL